MTSTTNAIAATATAGATPPESPAKTVADIESRKVFDSPDAALDYIAEISTYEGFDSLEQALVGFVAGEEGPEADPAVYDDTMNVAVAVVSEKRPAINGEAQPMRPVAFAVYPTPRTDAILSHPQGVAWLAKLIDKEANLAALRPLRAALKSGESVAAAVTAMPVSIAGYITPQRESGAGLAASYEAFWREIKKIMGAKSRNWSLANLSKRELRRAMESASYAAATYPKLEKDGAETSLFVMAAKIGELLTAKAGGEHSPEWFTNAIANRDAYVIAAQDDDEEAIDFADLASALAAPDDEDDGTESTTEEGDDA